MRGTGRITHWLFPLNSSNVIVNITSIKMSYKIRSTALLSHSKQVHVKCVTACDYFLLVVSLDQEEVSWEGDIFLKIFYLFCLHVCVCAPYVCIESPGAGVVDDWELPCGCWEVNLGPLQEEYVLLDTEPPLQPDETSCRAE